MPAKAKNNAWTTWEDMPLPEFITRAGKAKEAAGRFAAEIRELFPGLVTLTKEQRKFAPKLRDGEHAVLVKVLDVADLKPALFESIADADEGTDPNKFETDLLRERIEKHRLFTEIAAELEPLAEQVADSPLYLAGLFREALSAAYRIAKTHAETDKRINDILAPVLDFMRKGAVAAAASRKNK